MAVSRSSEKLTDLALPAKMRRTLSQEFIRQQQVKSFPSFNPGGVTSSSANVGGDQQAQQQGSSRRIHPQKATSSSIQQPGQHPGQQQQQPQGSGVEAEPSQSTLSLGNACVTATPLSDPSMSNAKVEVPASTKCCLCNQIHVDTQLRPCGHMFHGRCLKPTLQNAVGPPCCPIDNIPMHSAVLAVPTDEQPPSSTLQHAWDSNSGGTTKPTYAIPPIPAETTSNSG